MTTQMETEHKYEAAPGRLTPGSPAGEVVLSYLTAQVARLKSLDPAVRRDEPDSVHQMRVTTRRLRSTFQAFPAIVPAAATRRLRDELQRLGRVLGDARDNEVLGEYLRASLDATPVEQVMGPAQARIVAHFAPREAATRTAVLEALDSPAYFAMLAELDRLLDDPPLTPEAARPAGQVMQEAVARSYRRARRRIHRATRVPAGPARDTAFHQARKAVKRARYAAEAARPACGNKARRFARRMKAVQSVLGDHQDAVNARAAAREIGVRAHLAGENAFVFGLLHERADRDARQYQDQALRAWKRAAHGKASRWLS
jgi:CHAD domain-containing protein